MQQITKQILNNRILNILFNPNMPISKHEYWAGLIFIFLCMGISSAQSSIGGMMDSFLFSYSEHHFTAISSKLIFSSFTPNLIPYTTIILYSSFILSYKRCKTIELDKLRWISGLFTFLLYCTPFAAIMTITAMQSSTYDNMDFIAYSSICVGIIFAIGIFTILLLSFGGSSMSEDKEESPNSSIGFLFRLFFLCVTISVIFTIYMFIADIHVFSSTIYLIPLCALSVIFLFAYIWLIIKRTIDAGINVLIPICIMLIAPLIGVCFYFLCNSNLLSNSSVTISIISLSANIIFSISNILFLILVILPSQPNNSIEEENIFLK